MLNRLCLELENGTKTWEANNRTPFECGFVVLSRCAFIACMPIPDGSFSGANLCTQAVLKKHHRLFFNRLSSLELVDPHALYHVVHLSTFMPRVQASSGGRYGAFLFATYALVLGIAELVTLTAKPCGLATIQRKS